MLALLVVSNAADIRKSVDSMCIVVGPKGPMPCKVAEFGVRLSQLPVAPSKLHKTTSSNIYGCHRHTDRFDGDSFALLVLRGGCSFGTKARYALAAGASLLVVANSEHQEMLQPGADPKEITDEINGGLLVVMIAHTAGVAFGAQMRDKNTPLRIQVGYDLIGTAATGAQTPLRQQLSLHQRQLQWQEFMKLTANSTAITGWHANSARFVGRGIVMPAGGIVYLTNAWLSLRMLRRTGCELPVEVWHIGSDEVTKEWCDLLATVGATCIDALAVLREAPHIVDLFWPTGHMDLRGWEIKPIAVLLSKFAHVLFLDADNHALRDPTFLFDPPPPPGYGYTTQHTALFWPEFHDFPLDEQALSIFDISAREGWGAGVSGDEEDQECKANATAPPVWQIETGQMVIHKEVSWNALLLTCFLNTGARSRFYYGILWGDKDLFQLAWRAWGLSFHIVRTYPGLVGTAPTHDDTPPRLEELICCQAHRYCGRSFLQFTPVSSCNAGSACVGSDEAEASLPLFLHSVFAKRGPEEHHMREKLWQVAKTYPGVQWWPIQSGADVGMEDSAEAKTSCVGYANKLGFGMDLPAPEAVERRCDSWAKEWQLTPHPQHGVDMTEGETRVEAEMASRQGEDEAGCGLEQLLLEDLGRLRSLPLYAALLTANENNASVPIN